MNKVRTEPGDPNQGCVLFTWRDRGSTAAVALDVLRSVANTLREQGYEPTPVGPGKGCAATFGVAAAGASVTVIAGNDGGTFWIASWEDADDTQAASDYTPSSTLAAVRAATRVTLDAEDCATDTRWMTIREWPLEARSGMRRDSSRTSGDQ